jgi:hypothetical protein
MIQFKNGQKICLAIGMVAATVWSCGKTQLNYGGPVPTQGSTPTLTGQNPGGLIKVRYGSLELVENMIAKSGFVNYAMYEDGSIVYEGVVNFLGQYTGNAYWSYLFMLDSRGQYLSQSFKGSIKASPNSIKSSSYRNNGSVLVDTEIQMKVNEATNNLRTVGVSFLPATKRPYARSGSPTDHEATGIVRIDTTGDLIDIIDAEFNGNVFNLPMNFRVRKHRAE